MYIITFCSLNTHFLWYVSGNLKYCFLHQVHHIFFPALGTVSRKSRNFSGGIILFVSSWSTRTCSVTWNFAVFLIFIPFTTYEKTSFTKWAGRSFTNGFSGPKVFRTFKKRALGDIIVLIRRIIKGLVHTFAFSVWPFSVISLPYFPFSRINKQMDKLISVDIDN